MPELQHYDFAVIGGGPAGYVAAIRAGQLGLKTAIVDSGSQYGGTCLHRGCIPTKDLLFNAEVYQFLQNAADFGIAVPSLKLDWNAVQARKNKIVKRLAQGVEYLLKKNKVEMIHGAARLAGPGRVSVATPKIREFEARNIVLATGSEAKTLPGLQPDASSILTSTEALTLKAPPASIAVIGAGAVGVEFASIFHRFGSHVTLIELAGRILPGEDEEISAELERALKRQTIAAHTGAKVESAAKTGKAVRVVFSLRDGSVERIDAEALLMAMGRTPNTSNLGLETTRIELVNGYIKTDEMMRTAEPGVYAVGDVVAGAPMLAHAGEAEGLVAAAHAAGKQPEPVNHRQTPNCIYSEPEVASVGLTEKQAREAGHKIRIGKFPFSANSKAAILGAREGFVKIVSEERYGEILGVHMIGPRVTELIAEAVVAMRLEATADDLAHAVHPHPTLSEAIMEAAHAAVDQPIHL